MTQTAARREETRRSFLEESAWMRFSSPLFSALSRACADDTDMIELGATARPGQPVGILLPVSVQFLLLKSPEPALAQYFASMTQAPKPATEAFPSFREFCLDRRDEVQHLLQTRTVNTNLVERSSTILPALVYVSRLVEQPLTLVEICCSVGLNLLFDKYHYDYGAAGRIGSDSSSVRLGCKSVGSSSPPVDCIPQVATRVGVDLVRIDPTDPIEQLWMQAALCPEWRQERAHLKTALSYRAAHPIRILEGDALETLPALLQELPGTVCLLHTHCMGYWTQEAKAGLDDLLRREARERDIHRVAIDRLYEERPEWIRTRLAKLASAGIPLTQKSLPSSIEHIWYRRSDAKTRALGQADGCGAWIDWGPTG